MFPRAMGTTSTSSHKIPAIRRFGGAAIGRSRGYRQAHDSLDDRVRPDSRYNSAVIRWFPMVTLRVIDGHECGKVYDSLPCPITLGREEDNAIRLNDERVSRFHAKIQIDDGRVILTDLESTNGTRVNGHPIKMRVLQQGDQISIGRSVLLFGDDVAVPDAAEEVDSSDVTLSGRAARTHDDAEPGELFPGGPPNLPSKLTPGQKAELSDLLTYVHQQLMGVSLTSFAGSDDDTDYGPHTIVPQPAWRHLTALQATLAQYLKEVSEN